MKESILNFIELAAIILSATFGVLGAATKTKDSNGNLTRWGKIALAGIVLLGSFSFINNYLKQQIAAENKLKAKEAENKRLKEEQAFQQKVIDKADTSLSMQIGIQQRTDELLNDLNTSMGVQQNIFFTNQRINENVDRNLEAQSLLLTAQDSLSRQQKSVLFNTNRQLYRLTNARFFYVLSFDCNSEFFKEFTKKIKDTCLVIIKKKADYKTQTSFWDEKYGVSGFYNIRGDTLNIIDVSIQPFSPLIPNNSFNEELNLFNTSVLLSKKDISDSDLNTEADLVYDVKAWNEENGFGHVNKQNDSEYTGRSTIGYGINFLDQKISFSIRTTRARKGQDITGKIISLLDLPGIYVKVYFFGNSKLGKTATLSWFQMDFGEDHSQQVRFTSYEIDKKASFPLTFLYRIKEENIFR